MENIVKEYYKLRYKKYGGRTEYMRLIGGDCDEIYRTIGYAMEDIHAGDRIDIDPVTGECRRQRGNVGVKNANPHCNPALPLPTLARAVCDPPATPRQQNAHNHNRRDEH